MTARQYENIVKISHKATLDENTAFTKSLKIFDFATHDQIVKLVHCYNTQVYKKGEIFLNSNKSPQQIFILKQGQLKVEKLVTIKSSNAWPIERRRKKIL